MARTRALRLAGGTIVIPSAALAWQFARSAGPGGQHVNRTSSKAVLRFVVRQSPYLPTEVRTRLEEQQRSRLTAEGDLVGIPNDGSVGLWSGGSWTPMFLRAPIDEPFRRHAMARDVSLLAVSTKDRKLTALRLGRKVVSPADASLWVDLLAPYRLSPDGQHEPISPEQRLAAWRRLAR